MHKNSEKSQLQIIIEVQHSDQKPNLIMGYAVNTKITRETDKENRIGKKADGNNHFEPNKYLFSMKRTAGDNVLDELTANASTTH